MKPFIHMPAKEETMAMKKIMFDGELYKIDAISIGNVPHLMKQSFIKKIAFDKPIQVLLFGSRSFSCTQHLKLIAKSSQIMM
jgi:hypothetical protein